MDEKNNKLGLIWDRLVSEQHAKCEHSAWLLLSRLLHSSPILVTQTSDDDLEGLYVICNVKTTPFVIFIRSWFDDDENSGDSDGDATQYSLYYLPMNRFPFLHVLDNVQERKEERERWACWSTYSFSPSRSPSGWYATIKLGIDLRTNSLDSGVV